jgi:hypothetical protein
MKRIKNSDPNTVYLKAVDTNTNEIVGMAKWNIWREDTFKDSDKADSKGHFWETLEDEVKHCNHWYLTTTELIPG